MSGCVDDYLFAFMIEFVVLSVLFPYFFHCFRVICPSVYSPIPPTILHDGFVGGCGKGFAFHISEDDIIDAFAVQIGGGVLVEMRTEINESGSGGGDGETSEWRGRGGCRIRRLYFSLATIHAVI